MRNNGDIFLNFQYHTQILTYNCKVVFVGEAGEDGGGPRRELWRLFGMSLKGSHLEGEDTKMVFRHDTLALQVMS